MLALLALLFAVSSALAYQVTFPNTNEDWTNGGSNLLEWNRVSTDPLNFSAVLVNMNNTNAQILDSLVDGTSGSILLNAPQGGWELGSAYRVNLAESADQLDSLLAQSNQFNITAGSASSTTSSSTSTLTTTSATSTTSGASTSVSSSDTSTTPTGTSAATLDADARAGLFTAVAVLTVLAVTFF